MTIDSTLVLRALGQATPDLIYALDRAGRYTFVSEPAARILGTTPEAMIGRTWTEIGLPPEREREFVVEREQVIATGEPIRREVSFPLGSGIRTFEYVISPLIDDQSNAHGVLVVSRDITERAAMERDLREQLEFRRAIERSVAPGILTIDREARISYASPSFTAMTGWTEEDLRGCGVPYPHWPPEEHERLTARLRGAVAGETLPPRSELTLMRKDGRRFPAIVDTSALIDEGGNVIGWLGVMSDASEQERAERLYRELADAMPQIVWTADANGGIDYFNRRWYEITGDHATGIDVLHPEDYERCGGEWRHAIETGAPFETECRVYDARSGTYRWYLTRALPSCDEQGHVVRWYGTSTDVEDLRRLALDNQNLLERIRREEERYRMLVTATAQIVWSATASGGPRSDNPMWRSITGQSSDDVRTGSWADAVHPDDRERVQQAWRHSVATGAPYQAEFRIQTRDGAFRWFASRGVPVREADGAIREWIGTATDIDDSKRADEASSFLSDASALLSSSLDPETVLTRLAQIAVPRIADWAAVDVVQENAPRKRLVIAHPDPAKLAAIQEIDRRYRVPPERDPVEQVLTTGEPQLMESAPAELIESFAADEAHLQFIRMIGVRSWVIVPIKVSGRRYGALTLVQAESGRRFNERDLMLAQDVAARAGVAVENAELYLAAQAANHAKDEFLATLSHELRTPLTAILGWARMLSMGLAPDEMFGEALTSIERGARVQAQLIDDLLDLSRITLGKLHLAMEVVSLDDVVKNAVDTVRPAANAKGVAIEVVEDPARPRISGDPNRLQQVVWNLVNNAVKFTPAGGRVKVEIDRVNRMVRVRVSDTGEGIVPEFLPHLFERFRQADSTTTRRFGGLGLGLAIVKQITELHGGTVSAESAGRGRGATFTVTFPLLGGAAAEDDVHAKIRLSRLEAVDVLVVDDDPQTRRFVAAALETAGASVRVAGSAAEALAAIRRNVPKVLLTDIAMPERDGFALVSDVRTLLRIGEERMAAIAMTAFGHTDDRVRILASGFQRYLMKPIDPADLARNVAEVVQK